MRASVLRSGLYAALPILAACGQGGGGRTVTDGDAGPQAQFVALQGDFACYRTWESADGGTMAIDGLAIALPAQRTIYANFLPPAGSTAFPEGTILVKETAGAQTFAMAKRGGGFNPSVDDWEWFELTVAPTSPPTACKPVINWRGTAPPVGTVYGGQFTQCSGCHAMAADNDNVAGAWPSLKDPSP
jgi:hypothetical protein